MIVKIQRAIMPPDGPVLIYDQHRTHMNTAPMTPDLEKKLQGKLKIYTEAEFKDGNWVIGRIVPDRAW